MTTREVSEARSYPFSEPERLETEPLFRTLRQEEPLSRVRLPYGEPAWLATRYEDVKVVLGDPRFSRAASVGRDEPRMRAHLPPPGNILSMDPPDHSRLRRLVTKAFTVRSVERLRSRAQEIADGLVDDMLAKGPPADLVADFALPLPSRMVTALLGVPYEDHPFFYDVTKVIGDQRIDDLEYRMKVRMQLWAYMDKLVQAKTADPADDLLSRISARRERAGVSHDEVVGIATLLIIAGYETVANQLGVGTVALLRHPDQLAELKADPDLLPGAIEELMRHQTVLDYGARRVATADVEIGGQLIRSGEGVVVVMAAANRDERVFEDADRLDIHRTARENLAFGYGPHQCIGQLLARVQLRVAWETLFRRLPGLRLAVPFEELPFRYDMFVYGVDALPVTW